MIRFPEYSGAQQQLRDLLACSTQSSELHLVGLKLSPKNRLNNESAALGTDAGGPERRVASSGSRSSSAFEGEKGITREPLSYRRTSANINGLPDAKCYQAGHICLSQNTTISTSLQHHVRRCGIVCVRLANFPPCAQRWVI